MVGRTNSRFSKPERAQSTAGGFVALGAQTREIRYCCPVTSGAPVRHSRVTFPVVGSFPYWMNCDGKGHAAVVSNCCAGENVQLGGASLPPRLFPTATWNVTVPLSLAPVPGTRVIIPLASVACMPGLIRA